MAFSFAKKLNNSASSSDQQSESAKDESASTAKQTTSTASPKTSTPNGKSPSWVKTGKAAKEALAEEEAKAAMAKEAQGKMWRFWMPEDSERQGTFLNGEVDSDGLLDIPMFYEHSMKINGKTQQFICTAEAEGYCPICDRGDAKPYLVGVLTIIDHHPYKIKNGANAGKTVQNVRKLFVAKKATINLLTKLAVKRGGLTGCTFDITRGDSKSAAVGTMFDYVSKHTSSEIAAKFGLKPEEVQPAKLEDEIVYKSAKELVDLGVGKAVNGFGTETGVSDSDGDSKNLADHL